MDLTVLSFMRASADYYEPPDRAKDESTRFWPTAVPVGWAGTRRGDWQVWEETGSEAGGHHGPMQGWKIHVSATLPRAQHVLDTVATVCFAEHISFKHLATELVYISTHHKHAARPQAGKFCTMYPPDLPAARHLLELLADRLKGEDGPYILSDRRYRDSRTVHYRYGAFRMIAQTRPDGTQKRLLQDGSGGWTEDRRNVRFTLPAGVSDPFVEPPPEPASGEPPAEGIRIGDYRVLRALAHSNGGGAYRAVDRSDSPVFLKEARAHNGLFWDRTTARSRLRREHRVLCELHQLAPGLAPEPLDYFREWEHDFLATELVPGQSLFEFMVQRNPYLRASTKAEFEEYFEICRTFLDQLAATLHRLHRAGYRFGDVNPRNLLVTAAGGLRLVDFEACGRLDEAPIDMGAPGYLPTREQDRAGTGVDEYGLSAVAFALILPVHQVAVRNPETLDHLYADVCRYATPPADLWRLATRNFADRLPATGSAAVRRPDRGAGRGSLPHPDELAADPVIHLRKLGDALGRELAAAAEPDRPDRVYPTIPRGYLSNTLCVAYGTAGVLHALQHGGRPAPAAVVERFRKEALERREELPAGLHTGTAGIGWVLAELGYLDEATELLAAAGSHRTVRVSCTWAGGMAGVGAARLALYAYSGMEHQLREAARLGDALCDPDNEELPPIGGTRDAVGLLHGRAGVAMFLYHLWRATGDDRYLRYGITLLHAELDRAIELPGGELGFPDDNVARRVMPYLAIGSAGVGHALTRYLQACRDERLTDATPRVFAYADRPLAAEPGLYQGLAGLGFALADHADLAGGDDRYYAGAVRAAAGLFKYAAPGPDGRVRFLGEYSFRFSTELYSGAAGILLAVDRILGGPNGQFFTLDHLVPVVADQVLDGGALVDQAPVSARATERR